MARKMQNAKFVLDARSEYPAIIMIAKEFDFNYANGANYPLSSLKTLVVDNTGYLDKHGIQMQPPIQMPEIQLKAGDVLNVSGSSKLSIPVTHGTMYEVALETMFLKGTETVGWDNGKPSVKVTLQTPPGYKENSTTLTRTLQLDHTAMLKWKETLIGEFVTSESMRGAPLNFKIIIDASNINSTGTGKDLSGLVLMGVIVRKVQNYPLPQPLACGSWDGDNSCYFMDVTKLSVHRGGEKDHWALILEQDSRELDKYFPVLQLDNVFWFEVTGKFDGSNVNQGSTYEVRFVIKLDSDANGWDHIRTLNVKFNNQEALPVGPITRANYKDYGEFSLGKYTVSNDASDTSIEFTLSETKSGMSKTGLFIKAVRLIPLY